MYEKLAWIIAVLILVSPSLSAEAVDPLAYRNHKGLTSELKGVVKAHRDVASLASLAKTPGGRDVWAVTLARDTARVQPAVLIIGGVEGTDLASTEYCLGFLYAIDSLKTRLDHTTYYIIPRLNADAAEACFATPQYARRYNARSLDLDQDGLIDEDGYDDLNGDGFITQMRIEDPTGLWRPDDEIPQLLRKIDPGKGEIGQYRLLTEGKDNDRDGQWNEDEPGGVNLNRNFAYRFAFFTPGAGYHPFSETETRALADFVIAHPNIAVVFAFSPDNNLLHLPEAAQEAPKGRQPVTSVLPNDAKVWKQVADTFKAVTRFADAPKPAKVGGTLTEWAYYHAARFAFSAASWWPPRAAASPDTTEQTEKKEETQDDLTAQRRRYAAAHRDAFVPWTAFAHPDFPNHKVEIGGFKPYRLIHPPADSLSNRARRYGAFLTQLGDMLPRVVLDRITITQLHDRVYRLEAVVTNTGILPTNTQLGVRSAWTTRVRARLNLGENQKLASGRPIQYIDALPGGGGSRKLTWVIISKAGASVSLSAGSPMAGAVQKTVTLN